ncbi:hypothetical protein TNCT_485101 [Trichonephila clavata]|uniref:Uncharacterized protein n=1 Tax=Trichonephila clavata TaxID=2740835 RepID=A0A8X6FD04_TRICU|nr:hypothetical protein TNCT_485101 [Trichonephila clavata]
MSHLKQQIRIRLVNICFSILLSARQGGTTESLSASSVDFPSPPTALGGVRFFRSLVSGHRICKSSSLERNPGNWVFSPETAKSVQKKPRHAHAR